LKKQAKLERLIVPNRHSFSSLLRRFAFDIIFMNDLRNKLGYKKKGGHYRGTSPLDNPSS
jgi:hypothetical protein